MQLGEIATGQRQHPVDAFLDTSLEAELENTWGGGNFVWSHFEGHAS